MANWPQPRVRSPKSPSDPHIILYPVTLSVGYLASFALVQFALAQFGSFVRCIVRSAILMLTEIRYSQLLECCLRI